MVANLKIWTLHPYYSTLVMNKSSIYILENLWHRTQSTTMKKKKSFLKDHTCPPPNTLPHHSFSLFLSLSPVLTSPHFSFLSFSSFSFPSSTSLHSLILSHGTHSKSTSPPPFFRQDHWKFLWTHKHLHDFFLFEVKISNLFCEFYTFAWGYFYLNFNNDTHVIYEHWKWYLRDFMYEFCIGGRSEERR